MSPPGVDADAHSDTTTDESNICIDCGMCCDGTLHLQVSVRPDDDPEVLTAKGLAIRPRGEELAFDQPCVVFGAGRCGIYDWRPGACQSYRCRLLRRVDEGEVGVGEARQLIREAKALSDRVRTGLHEIVAPGSPMPISEMRRRLESMLDAPVDSGASVGDHTELLLETETLGLLLTRHFDDNDVASS